MRRGLIASSIISITFSLGVVAQHQACSGNVSYIADGYCDLETNNMDCSYDGGDCCECTCLDGESYACGIGGFNCIDPDAADPLHNCQDASVIATACSTDAPSEWLMQDTASAIALAEAVRCSGGYFNVVWKGAVTVNQTMYVANGTTLNVTGAENGGNVQGGMGTRLFAVVNSSLHLNNLLISNGHALAGGAIAAAGSSLSFDRISFVNNTALGNGGALHIVSGSTLTWGGVTEVVGNSAGSFGGALYIDSGSSAFWLGSTIFSGNNAAYGGGALSIGCNSVAFGGAATLFSNNTADVGGAMFLVKYSIASSVAELFFIQNVASFGGAIYVGLMSTVSWGAKTSFIGNKANYSGGALSIEFSSEASWDAETVFLANAAGSHGGALSLSYSSNVLWEAATRFSGNIASFGGAIELYVDSNASWKASTTFSGNAGLVEGGALYVFDGSEASWDGDTTFTANTAEFSWGGGLSLKYSSSVCWQAATNFSENNARFGGAVALLNESTAFWNASTTFTRNSANFTGGALSIYGASRASWEAQTTFTNNAAPNGGAVHALLASVAHWEAETVFSGNVAEIHGGALGVSVLSEVSWEAPTTFWGNNAYHLGGAVSLFQNSTLRCKAPINFTGNLASGTGGAIGIFKYSNLYCGAETVFTNNTAIQFGGAVGAAESSGASWGARTLFSQNIANERGGAVMVGQKSTFVWDADSTFSHNSARSHAGAVYLWSESSANWKGVTSFVNNTSGDDGGALYGSSSHVSMEDHAIFRGNRCAGSGGGIAIVTGGSTTFKAGNVTFHGNSADVSGGGLFASGLVNGPHFTRFRFISNVAQVGGGVHITGSGTQRTEDVISGEVVEDPTVFEGCEFMDNKAIASGGALDSSSGRDEISSSRFQGNTAGVGGLRDLQGLHSSLHVHREGPALSNIGYITRISDTSFEENVFNCDPGMYLSYRTPATSNDLFHMVCDGCAVECDGCIAHGVVPECIPEIDHSTSTGGFMTVETLNIEQGYWRATSTSTNVLACYNAKACRGGMTGAPGYCGDGYEGPYCSICSDGYTATLGFTCNECLSNVAGVTLLAVVAVIAAFIVAGVLYYMVSGVEWGDSRSENDGVIATLKRRLQSLKIVIVVWQILTQFTSMANVIYLNIYQRFLDGVVFFNFDLTWIISTGCVVDVNFHERLMMSTTGPLVALAVLGVTYTSATNMNRGSDEVLGRVRRRHLSMVFLLTFLVYSPVSSVLFQMFACDDLDNGKIYLRADYRIECDSPVHQALQVYAGLMILVYTVGIPTFYAAVLYRNRNLLMDTRVREHDAVAQSISGLWGLYKPNHIYHELVECARRILLAGVVVFIYPNSAAQVAIALMLGGFFMLVSEAAAPYERELDAWVSRMGHAIVCTSMFLALLLKVDVANEQVKAQKVYELTLVLAHVCMVLAVVGESLVMSYQFYKARRGIHP